jgi:transcription initiation factor TFIIIB Brf1 subunit/transcription initiation factor TFIIB
MIKCNICGKEFKGVSDLSSKEIVCHPCRIWKGKTMKEFMADLEVHEDILDKHLHRGKYQGNPPRDGHDFV